MNQSVSNMFPEGQVAVLFARSDSIYKTIQGCDVWDAERDARNWPGGCSVIAHPPCRAWGRLRAFAKPRPDEKDLARWSVCVVREWGGVIEHPAGSTLWNDQNLPFPGQTDDYGGWTMAAPQLWWGHKANKATWFYIVGCNPTNIPPVPFTLSYPTHVVQSRKRKNYLPHISKAEREHTPPKLAQWLFELALKCRDFKKAA